MSKAWNSCAHRLFRSSYLLELHAQILMLCLHHVTREHDPASRDYARLSTEIVAEWTAVVAKWRVHVDSKMDYL